MKWVRIESGFNSRILDSYHLPTPSCTSRISPMSNSRSPYGTTSLPPPFSHHCNCQLIKNGNKLIRFSHKQIIAYCASLRCRRRCCGSAAPSNPMKKKITHTIGLSCSLLVFVLIIILAILVIVAVVISRRHRRLQQVDNRVRRRRGRKHIRTMKRTMKPELSKRAAMATAIVANDASRRCRISSCGRDW